MYVKSTKAHAGELGGLATRSRELGAFFLLFYQLLPFHLFERAQKASLLAHALTEHLVTRRPMGPMHAEHVTVVNFATTTQATTTQAMTTRASREQARTANPHLRMRSKHARIGNVRIAKQNWTGRQAPATGNPVNSTDGKISVSQRVSAPYLNISA